MSKKAWRWFDRLVLFGGFSLLFTVVSTTIRSCLMDKGYGIPEEQKAHLQGGALYVRDKFDNAAIQPPTTDTVSRINQAQVSSDQTPKPVSRPKTFTERMKGYGEYKSPLGSTLGSSASALATKHQPVRPTQSEDPSLQVKSQPITSPPQVERRVKLVQEKPVDQERGQSSTSVFSADDFVIDLKTKTGSFRRFVFSIEQTKQKGMMKLRVAEFTGLSREIGGNMKMNIIVFNPKKQNELGIAFSIIFHHNKGFLVAPYDKSLDSAVFIAKGDKICVAYNTQKRGPQIIADNIKVSLGMKKLNETTRYVSTIKLPVRPQVIQKHKNNKIPVVNPQHYR